MFNPTNREEDEETKQKRERNAGWNYSGMEEVLGDGSVRACVRVMTSYAPVPRVTMYIMFSEWSGVDSVVF
jgi:hypothetical protein